MDIQAQNLLAVLFSSGQTLTAKTLKKVLDLSESELNEALERLNLALNDLPFNLVTGADGYALSLKTEFMPVATQVAKLETVGDLTPAALETLSLIAYRGPISKINLEQIRGVNCSLALRLLRQRDLIAPINSEEKNPEANSDFNDDTVYGLSTLALRQLGLSASNQLPEYNEFGPQIPLEKLLDQSSTEPAQTFGA